MTVLSCPCPPSKNNSSANFHLVILLSFQEFPGSHNKKFSLPSNSSRCIHFSSSRIQPDFCAFLFSSLLTFLCTKPCHSRKSLLFPDEPKVSPKATCVLLHPSHACIYILCGHRAYMAGLRI